jgi:3alpha(or 20beta)-hydroxysteroid dehydrogenase
VADNGSTAGGNRLDGKVAIVTGAARGLGASIAELYAGEGAKVLLTDVRDDEGEAVAAGIRETGGTAVYQHLDVTSPDEWTAAVERCESELGPVNVLVNNAFIYSQPAIADVSWEEWSRNIDVNLNGPFHGFRAVLPGMRERRDGTFVTISSSNGNEMSLPAQVSYQAAKAGLTAVTRHIAVAYAAEGIRANSIHPGPIRTPGLVEQDFMEMAEFIATGFPIQRLAEPEEVAWAAVYLASNESSYTTATELVIDGGSVSTINVPGKKG